MSSDVAGVLRVPINSPKTSASMSASLSHEVFEPLSSAVFIPQGCEQTCSPSNYAEYPLHCLPHGGD
jgi:hypothetical protein